MILLYLLSVFVISLAAEDIVIRDAGIFDIKEGDIAIIFYVTIENTSEKDTGISVSMNKCCDEAHTSDRYSCDSMYIIGGYMGVLKSKHTMNATLIYPNMYTYFRQGTCTITVNYRLDKYDKVLTKMINFRTNNTADESYSGQNQCATVDLDSQDNCNRVDCVLKYSGERNYFNPSTKECERVPVCVSDPTNGVEIGYSLITNQCINLRDTIQPSDIEFLDSNQADVIDDMNMYQTNKICHRGEIDFSNTECVCSSGWRTSLSGDDVYEPSLLLYHMCNVETGTWNCVNKTKIQTTILIISILVLTVASKVLIVMCILTWCYKHFTKSNVIVCTSKEKDDYEKLLIQNPLEDNDKCICTDLKERKKIPSLYKQTVDISYYPGRRDSYKMASDASKSRANKEEEYSIQLEHSSSSSNDDDTTENEDNINESSEQKKINEAESLPKNSKPEEETETTDYSIRLSNTTSSNPGIHPTDDSTESEEYVVDLEKNEEPHQPQ
ncbi:uncharacterized protein LOC130892571 [Diorhabda carinulata]|uniref:uncharacterized protein LOC130892571 n=1 Tax=Diorhabda carinulata TaxID=1163345 RepID=UPI0025A0C085|nr:uncharacterized protein LOC130892571 [Diorhabda carinulata]